MTRLQRLTRDGLTTRQRELFDHFANTDRIDQRAPFPPVGPDGALEGPFNALLYSPELGTALQSIGLALRTSTLTERCRELAILMVASAWNSGFEWAAHREIARKVGVTDAQIDAIAEGDLPETDDATEALIARTARSLAAYGDLDDDEYTAAIEGLGERTLFELVTLVGYYAHLALQMRVFRVTPPTIGES